MLVILRQPLYILLMCLVWATVPIAFKLVTLGICLLLCIDASNSLGYCLVYNWVYSLLVCSSWVRGWVSFKYFWVFSFFFLWSFPVVFFLSLRSTTTLLSSFWWVTYLCVRLAEPCIWAEQCATRQRQLYTSYYTIDCSSCYCYMLNLFDYFYFEVRFSVNWYVTLIVFYPHISEWYWILTCLLCWDYFFVFYTCL